MSTRCCPLIALLGLCFVGSTLADIPNPRRQPQPQPQPQSGNRIVAPVVIRNGGIRDEGRLVQAKIVIPRSLLAAAQEEVIRPKRGGSAPLPPTPEEARLGSPLRSVVAGVAMSLAAVSLVFVIRGNRGLKTAALATLAGAVVLGSLGIAMADLAPPNRRNPPAPPPRIAEADSEIVIELTDVGDTVTLQLAR